MIVRTLTLLCLTASLPAPVSAQGAYAWDHPDGLGVRYLLYKKMKQREVRPKIEGEFLRRGYVPTDEADFVRVNGYPFAWGVDVYEFPAPQEHGFAAHVEGNVPEEKVRKVLVPGKEAKGDIDYRYWEYVDQFAGYGVVVFEKPAAGRGYRWAQNDDLGVRFKVHETMTSNKVNAKTDGPHAVADLFPHRDHWVAIPGQKRPQAWHLRLYRFPEKGGFAAWFGGEDPRSKERKFEVRDKPAKGCGIWEWTNPYAKRLECGIAAVYAHGDGEVALVCTVPTGDGRIDGKLRKTALELVTSLTTSTLDGGEIAGGKHYFVAASYPVGGKEVALVVAIPLDDGANPDRTLLARARKMVRSLKVDDGVGR